MGKALWMALGLAVALSGCGSADTVATVGGEAISKEQFEAYLKFKRVPENDSARRAAALREYTERAALAKAIEDSGLLEKELTAAELEEFRKEMLISRYFQKFLDERVSDQAVESYYAQNADQFQEKKVHVAHILQRTHSKMSEEERKAKLTALQEAFSKLKTGADFAEVAKQYSEDKVSGGRGGDLGWMKEGAISPRFSEVIFSTAAGQISEPFETPFGYHVVKVIEGPMVVKRPIEAVKGDVRYQLRNQAKNAEMERLRKQVKVEIREQQQPKG